MSVAVVDQLLNWGPITFVLAVPFVSFVLRRHDGVAIVMRAAGALTMAGAVLRLLPGWALPLAPDAGGSTLLLHAAQILNGIAGPLLIAAPSRLSRLWFAASARATVTAVANASLFGAAAGFYLGPALIGTDPGRVPRLLWCSACVSAVPFLLVVAYCPVPPPCPLLAADAGAGTFLRSALRLMRDRTTAVLVLLMGIGAGMYDAWIGVLPQILTGTNASAPEERWSQARAGECGMVHTFACIVGMWVGGAVADRAFARKFKRLLLILFAAAGAMLLLTVLQLERNGLGIAAIPHTVDTTFGTIALAGFFRTATSPVLYELAAEVTHPEPEGTSAGLIVMAEHLVLLSMLFVLSHTEQGQVPAVANIGCLVAVALCIALVPLIRERYGRSDAEAALERSRAAVN